MEAWKKEQLTAAGVDVHGALERFMGNEALLERMLQRFTGDANYAQLLAADKRDTEEALRAAHTLKGMTGNLSMTALCPLFTRQVELLRAGDPDGAYAMLPEITLAYERIVGAIGAIGR
ncbi:Hpt domain-containing protein [Intestinimonas butyriciproducens]|uniref:Hpt domain-containing protein n=1 Tax=Intestinimonas butyriciproducens TaxID=1297617 RepID=UPI002672A347|nr:Hpt domain-containing protein [Intestinimonas butyriciproducens]